MTADSSNKELIVFEFLIACLFISCCLAILHSLVRMMRVDGSERSRTDQYFGCTRNQRFCTVFNLFPSTLSTNNLLSILEEYTYISALTFLWYFISLSFTLFNKWFMEQYQRQYFYAFKINVTGKDSFVGFNYPIIITAVHMMVKFTSTRIWRLTNRSIPIPIVKWQHFLVVIVPIGVLTSLDIVFSNQSILYLPLSLCTAVKASSLVFTFLFGLLPCLKTHIFQWQTLGCIVAITIGLAVAIYCTQPSKVSDANRANNSNHSATKYAVGLLFAFGSAAAGGLRWVLLQKLVEEDASSPHTTNCSGSNHGSQQQNLALEREKELQSSAMLALYRFTPISAIAIVPFAAGLELPQLLYQYSEQERLDGRTAADEMYAGAALLCISGGLFAVCLILVEVKLLQVTSSLTLSVIGQLKEVVLILIAMSLFSEKVSPLSGLGIFLSISGSYLYRRAVAANHIRSRDSDSDIELHYSDRIINISSCSNDDAELLMDPSDVELSPLITTEQLKEASSDERRRP